MPCGIAKRRIINALVDRRLSDTRTKLFKRHVQTCHVCEEELRFRLLVRTHMSIELSGLRTSACPSPQMVIEHATRDDTSPLPIQTQTHIVNCRLCNQIALHSLVEPTPRRSHFVRYVTEAFLATNFPQALPSLEYTWKVLKNKTPEIAQSFWLGHPESSAQQVTGLSLLGRFDPSESIDVSALVLISSLAESQQRPTDDLESLRNEFATRSRRFAISPLISRKLFMFLEQNSKIASVLFTPE